MMGSHVQGISSNETSTETLRPSIISHLSSSSAWYQITTADLQPSGCVSSIDADPGLYLGSHWPASVAAISPCGTTLSIPKLVRKQTEGGVIDNVSTDIVMFQHPRLGARMSLLFALPHPNNP